MTSADHATTAVHSPKITKILYRVSTILLGLFIIPGIIYINSDFAKEGRRHIGTPDRLGYEVGIGSFIGAWLIVLPMIGSRLKERAYVALGIVYISAFIGHAAVDGRVGITFSPFLPLALLIVSYVTYHKLHTTTK